jgi:CP12 domain
MLQISESVQAVVNSYQNGKITIDQAIHEALIAARATCDLSGKYSPECILVWDIVEELQVERSHRRQESKIPTSFDYHCYFHPEADECRIYDV